MAKKPSLTARQDGQQRLRGATSAEMDYKLFVEPAREARAFFETPAFGELIAAFKSATETGVVNYQDLKYAAKGAYPFSAADFKKTFDAVMIGAPGKPWRTVLVNDFMSVTKEYEGMVFKALTGTEPLYFIEKAEPA